MRALICRKCLETRWVLHNVGKGWAYALLAPPQLMHDLVHGHASAQLQVQNVDVTIPCMLSVDVLSSYSMHAGACMTRADS